MSLDAQLDALERAELIRLVQRVPETEYLFRHGLVQDAAYGSLLRSARRELHASIGAALERLYADRLDELAAVLARHYAEADLPAQALRHYTRAGELAAAKHANVEALMHFDAALDMARRAEGPTAALRTARGRIYELTGEFERARADFDAALSEARAAGDRRTEWQALIASGLLWAARDYARTGDYFHGATEIARALNDPRALAHSLNWLGNWHANIEQPWEAMRMHHEALAIYERLGDGRGIAESQDLLAMGGLLAGDLVQSREYAGRAASGFLALNSPREAASSLLTASIAAATIGSEQSVFPDVSSAEAMGTVREALRLARQIGWRSGEAFALIGISDLATARGEYGEALDTAREGLEIAIEIGHAQWQVGAHIALGVAQCHVADLRAGEDNLDKAWALAATIGSGYWRRFAGGLYALMAARFGDESAQRRAESFVTQALGADASPAGPLTYGQRVCWAGRIELALARRDARRALEWAESLIACLPNAGAPHTTGHSPHLRLLRGEALLVLGRLDEAADELRGARSIYKRFGMRPALRRTLLALARLSQARGDDGAAGAARAEARALAEEIAAGIPDGAQREAYLRRADTGTDNS